MKILQITEPSRFSSLKSSSLFPWLKLNADYTLFRSRQRRNVMKLQCSRDPRETEDSAKIFVKFKEYEAEYKAELTEENIDFWIEAFSYLKELYDVPEWMQNPEDLQSEMSNWVGEAIKKFQDLKRNKTKLSFEEALNDVVESSSFRIRSYIALLGVCVKISATFLGYSLLAWIVSFADINPYENFRFPEGFGLQWLFWTAPYALFTFVAWNAGLLTKWKPFQGFKMATTFLEFKMEAVANPKQHGDVALLIKAIGNSWLFILMYQGIVLQSLQKILSVDPVQQETFLGGFQFSALPSLLRLPIEILTLSTLVATINLLSDTSLLFHADENMNMERILATSESDPRTGAKTLEEFELLNNRQITRQRAMFTFAYHFVNAAYLTLEALWTKSLYTSIGTLAFGSYIMLKSMQKKDD